MNPQSPLLSRAKHYVWGLLATSWNGGWSAVAGILGIDAVALTGADSGFTGATQVRVLNWHEMLSAFAGAFVLHGILWLKANPIPATYDTPAPFPPTNPPA